MGLHRSLGASSALDNDLGIKHHICVQGEKGIKREGAQAAQTNEEIKMPFNIVLLQPDIPQNTGNIARTCAVTGARLHLVKPLGFSIKDRYLKRAGLDYWGGLDITVYENTNDFFQKNKDASLYFFYNKGKPQLLRYKV